MIDHTGMIVSDFEQSKKFYANTLATIGYTLITEIPASITGDADVAGFGENGKPDFWVISGTPNKPPLHVAFRVNSRDIVDAFHKAGLTAAAVTMGNPGYGFTTIQTTTRRSFVMPTGTISKCMRPALRHITRRGRRNRSVREKVKWRGCDGIFNDLGRCCRLEASGSSVSVGKDGGALPEPYQAFAPGLFPSSQPQAYRLGHAPSHLTRANRQYPYFPSLHSVAISSSEGCPGTSHCDCA